VIINEIEFHNDILFETIILYNLLLNLNKNIVAKINY